MSIFRINIVACNPTHGEQTTLPLAALVDTDSELTWLPGEVLRNIGVEPRGKRTFEKATKQTVEREVGYAVLRANGRETEDEVVFAEPGDSTLIGARTLKAFGVTMEDDTHFISLATMAAFCAKRLAQPFPQAA